MIAVVRKRAAASIAWVKRHFVGIVIATTALLQVTLRGEPANWDWLFVTGMAVFAGAYKLSSHQPERVQRTLVRLTDRGVIITEKPDRAVARVAADLTRTVRRYRPLGCTLFTIVMLALWAAAFRGVPWRNQILWIELILAAFAGAVITKLVVYGQLSAVLKRNGLSPKPQQGHLDGASGLRPIGELYLRQATVVAFIGAFAGIWWLLIPRFPMYASWREPYVWVIVVAVACELLAFVAPLWGFHQVMRADRDERLREADKLGQRMADLTAQRQTAEDAEKKERLDADIEQVTKEWRAIEDMPTWPIDRRIRTRFAWNNVVVLIPVALKALSTPQWWQDLADAVTKASS